MKLKNLVLGAGLMLGCSVAAAEGINYTYVQGGYETITGTGSPDGLFVEGSYQVMDQLYVGGGYEMLSTSGYDMDILTARAGYIMSLSDTMDIYGGGGISHVKVSADVYQCYVVGFSVVCGTTSVSNSDTGLMLEGGMRMMVMPALEVNAGLRHRTGDFDETYLTGGAAYEFMSNLSGMGTVSYMLEAEEMQIQLGVRYGF